MVDVIKTNSPAIFQWEIEYDIRVGETKYAAREKRLIINAYTPEEAKTAAEEWAKKNSPHLRIISQSWMDITHVQAI